MIKYYFIDDNILTILLKTKNPEIITATNEKIVSGALVTIESTIDEFLKSKGIEMTFEALQNTEEGNVPKNVLELLKGEELASLIDNNFQLYYKAFLDQFWPTLSETNRLDIEAYLNDYQNIQKEYNDLLIEKLETFEYLKKQLLINLGVANPALEGQAQPVQQPQINLGGSISKEEPAQ
ncbi:MAG: hypothetical protein WCJ58_08065 [bacterium]